MDPNRKDPNMLALAENWKDEAKALADKARYIEEPFIQKMMIMKSETLIRCANELMKAYLAGLD